MQKFDKIRETVYDTSAKMNAAHQELETKKVENQLLETQI